MMIIKMSPNNMLVKFIIRSCFVALLISFNVVDGFVGINWGRQTSQRLIPSTVVDLLLQNGIKDVKIFSSSKNVIQAFTGSNISLTVAIPNADLKKYQNPAAVKDYVQRVVVHHINAKVWIRYIMASVEPFSPIYPSTTMLYHHDFVLVLKLLSEELIKADIGGVKATVPHFTDVITLDSLKPSSAKFRDDIRDIMIESLSIMDMYNAPFLMDTFPLYSLDQFNLDLEFAFIDNKSGFFIEDDNGLKYTNLFDFIYDSFVWALTKAGFPNMEIVIGTMGWPSDGILHGNPQNAERFYRGLLPHVTGKTGTPMRPGRSINIYLHNLADENRVNITRGPFQRHWGIYRYDGQPKYKIDFSGQGRDIFPVRARGVTKMPKRWCIFNGMSTNMSKIKAEFDFACWHADCSALARLSSCGNLTFEQNVSYAFNMFFQMRSQKESDKACRFNGLGKITPVDPSIGICEFPVQILSAEINDGERRSLFLSGAIRDYQAPVFLISLILPLILFTVLSFVFTG